MQCSPDPIVHLGLLRRTICPSRCEPQIRRMRGPTDDVPSEFALGRLVATASTMSFPFSATISGELVPARNWYFHEGLDRKSVNLLVDLAYAGRRVKGHDEILLASFREYGKRAVYPCRFCRLSDSNNRAMDAPCLWRGSRMDTAIERIQKCPFLKRCPVAERRTASSPGRRPIMGRNTCVFRVL